MKMREVIVGRVSAFIGDEMEYPGHLQELRIKMRELNALIYSVETGKPIPYY